MAVFMATCCAIYNCASSNDYQYVRTNIRVPSPEDVQLTVSIEGCGADDFPSEMERRVLYNTILRPY